eukprot:1157809-Pelagomonas_calceolata.AAC.11
MEHGKRLTKCVVNAQTKQQERRHLDGQVELDTASCSREHGGDRIRHSALGTLKTPPTTHKALPLEHSAAMPSSLRKEVGEGKHSLSKMRAPPTSASVHHQLKEGSKAQVKKHCRRVSGSFVNWSG